MAKAAVIVWETAVRAAEEHVAVPLALRATLPQSVPETESEKVAVPAAGVPVIPPVKVPVEGVKVKLPVALVVKTMLLPLGPAVLAVK